MISVNESDIDKKFCCKCKQLLEKQKKVCPTCFLEMYCSKECIKKHKTKHNTVCKPPPEWVSILIERLFIRYTDEIMNTEGLKLFQSLKNKRDRYMAKIKDYYLQSFKNIFPQFIQLKRRYTKNLETNIVKKYNNRPSQIKGLNPLRYAFITRVIDNSSGEIVINQLSTSNFESVINNILKYTRKKHPKIYLLQIFFIHNVKKVKYDYLKMNAITLLNKFNAISVGKRSFNYHFYDVDHIDDFKLNPRNSYYLFKKFNVSFNLEPRTYARSRRRLVAGLKLI